MPCKPMAVFALAHALSGNAAIAEPHTETWWINSAKKDCVGVAPMTCYEIQRNATIDPTAWELFYSSIQGFDYEPGYLYQVVIRVGDRPPPLPADVSSKTYELVEILSKAPDPSLRLTNLWKVLSVGDTTDPLNARGHPLVFEINASMRTYAGDLGCNRTRGTVLRNDGKNLELGPGMTTRMACPDMTLEQAVSQALEATRSYELKDGRLHFFDAEGEGLMSFMPVD